MGFRSALGRRGRRVIVLGLDGVPFTYIQRLVAAGELPAFEELIGAGAFAQMDTTVPNVSSVAWATFMTGRNPGKHRIFGFVDRQAGTGQFFVPNSQTMVGSTLWEVLSAAGKRVFAMNVPVTYPPRKVNGYVIGCFLSPTVEKAAPTAQIASALTRMKYCVDADARIAHRDKAAFLVHLDEVYERRLEAMRHFWRQERWDFYMAHVMETDRLHHFFWREMEADDARFAPAFLDFYRRIDALISEVMSWIDDEITLVVLSDHGFCSIKQQVFVNTWLEGAGYLEYADRPDAKGLAVLAPGTRAYSLDPGRVFLNVRGREPQGVVAPGGEYARVRQEVAATLSDMADPDTHEPMVERVYLREELYSGSYASDAPDIVLAMREGYDPKGAFGRERLTFNDDVLVGMHTTPDALLYVSGIPEFDRRPHIVDVAPTILDLLSVPVPTDFDGRSLLAA
jgi:predicted AlkP superfamily phosphohydrolase/phosphomutase